MFAAADFVMCCCAAALLRACRRSVCDNVNKEMGRKWGTHEKGKHSDIMVHVKEKECLKDSEKYVLGKR